jgi:exodeoxyribonuclease V alpha subunit
MSATLPLLNRDTAVLAPFVQAGVLDASAVHVAEVIARSVGGVDAAVLLGAALAARAPRFGHVCVVLSEVAESIVVDDPQLSTPAALPWPDLNQWAARLSASPAVCSPDTPQGEVRVPLVWDGERLYLERYWRYEDRIAGDLLRRAASAGGVAAPSADLEGILDALFGPDDPSSPDRQRAAVALALTRRLAVIAGGPGTGKTRTIARLVAAAHHVALTSGEKLDVALAAPTGKAAERMTESVRHEAVLLGMSGSVTDGMLAAEATTLHRLLGARGNGKFRHNRSDPLPHDIIVLDETSMVSLPLMARLLDAVRPDATVVLVGDPFQLTSVEAGAVLGEIVGTPASRLHGGPLAAAVVLLERVHRFSVDSAIAELADAIRLGEADRSLALLREGRAGELLWVDGEDERGIARLRAEVAANAVEVIRAARSGNAGEGLRLAADLKVLCATRFGPLGVFRWSDDTEDLAAHVLPDGGIGRRWYIGRPIIVTKNDYFNRIFNGDVGLVVGEAGQPVVAFQTGDGLRSLTPSQLGEVDTWWATTIHKSQGSEFRRVIVTLPSAPSPVLTRELLYTAVTRAKEQVMVVATESSLRTAISRPVSRASGLGPKLWLA